MSVLITSKDVELEFPTKRVFDKVTLGVNTGDRIGIVGKNGDGKSTLLSLLGGLLKPDTGEVIQRSSVTIGMLGQADALSDEATVAHEIVGDVPEYTWASDRTTREIIDALLTDISWDGIIKELSGGQRRRVDLARLLIGNWDVLMLDEPTNHLDMHAIAWLADHLKTRWSKGEGALLVVTHDRWFLDEACTSMWEVHDGTVDPFEGGYSAYVLGRVERDRVAQVTEQKRKNIMRKELAWLSRGARARATKPKFHVELAWELIDGEPPARNPLELKKVAMARLGKQVIDIIDVTECFGEKTVLDDVTWLIGPGDRFGILGINGAGKTTLLRVVQGALAPTKGHVKIGKTVKFSVLTQRLDELEAIANDRVREVLAQYKTRYMVDGKSMTPAQLLERLGFERNHLQARISDLSGGQKRRLQLLLTLLDEPNVLILDEPGNDMDTDMLAIMEDLLDSWPGTLILVSHDRYLMERVTDNQYALLDGKLQHMPGGVDEFLRLFDERNTAEGVASKNTAAASKNPEPASGDNFTASSTQKGSLSGGEAYQAKKLLASTERKIGTAEAQVEKIKNDMLTVDPSDFVRLGELEKSLQEMRSQIEYLENTWIDLSEQLG